jgi:hypothetical protein
MQKQHQRNDGVLKRIATEAKNHQIPVFLVKKRPGADQGKSLTKHENAQRIAEHFPVLRWNLPRKRKPRESEDCRSSIFTAADLAQKYLSQE